VVPTGNFREQPTQNRCVPRRGQAPLPAAFLSGSWCRRLSAISVLLKHRSGGDDWTHRIKRRPHRASRQQEKSERRFSVAQGLPRARVVRPNPSLKLSPNCVAHWACGAGASPQFCAAVPARHTIGATLARTLGIAIVHLLRLSISSNANTNALLRRYTASKAAKTKVHLGQSVSAKQQRFAVKSVTKFAQSSKVSLWACSRASSGGFVERRGSCRKTKLLRLAAQACSGQGAQASCNTKFSGTVRPWRPKPLLIPQHAMPNPSFKGRSNGGPPGLGHSVRLPIFCGPGLASLRRPPP
jgi:hypothetical protein